MHLLDRLRDPGRATVSGPSASVVGRLFTLDRSLIGVDPASSTTLTSSDNPSTFGQPVTFTASLGTQGGGGAVPGHRDLDDRRLPLHNGQPSTR